jgi:amino acid transporter
MSIVYFLFIIIIIIIIFVGLTPGIFLRLPSNGSKLTVAIVHGIIFALLMQVLYYYTLPYNLSNLEGFTKGKKGKKRKRRKKGKKKNKYYY